MEVAQQYDIAVFENLTITKGKGRAERGPRSDWQDEGQYCQHCAKRSCYGELHGSDLDRHRAAPAADG